MSNVEQTYEIVDEKEPSYTRSLPFDRHTSRVVSFMKGVSWRIVGTLDTFVLSYLISGHVSIAMKISCAEVFTKIFLYYAHERVWLSGLSFYHRRGQQELRNAKATRYCIQ